MRRTLNRVILFEERPPRLRLVTVSLQRPAHRALSAHDLLGMAEKAPVWGAARMGRRTFMRQRQGDVTLRVAAADLP